MPIRTPRSPLIRCLCAGMAAATLLPVPAAATDPGFGALNGFKFHEEEPAPRIQAETKAAGAARTGARRARLQAELAARAATGAAAPGARTLRPVRNRQGETLHVGPGAPLAYADLRGVSLRGLNLDGADLRWAKLADADLTGASLKGTQLSGADLTRAKGVDLAQARVHPFFAPWAEDDLGRDRLLLFPASTSPDDAFRQIQRGPRGEWYYLDGSSQEALGMLSPTGTLLGRPRLGGNSRMFALATDSRDRLWVFGDKLTAIARPRDAEVFGDLPFQRRNPVLGDIPTQVTAQADGFLYLSLRDRLQVAADTQEGFITGQFDALRWNGTAGERLVAGPRPGSLVKVGPGRGDLVFIDPTSGLALEGYPKEAATAIHGAASGSDGRVYFAQTGPRGIGWVDLATKKSGLIETKVDPGAVALGEDGAIWWTEPDAHRLMRLVPGGQPEPTILPSNIRPGELLAADGCLYYAFQGAAGLGVRRLVGQPKAAAVPAAAGPAGAAVKTKADPGDGKALTPDQALASFNPPALVRRPERVSKYLKGKERTAWLKEQMERAERRFLARQKATPEPKAPPKSWYRPWSEVASLGLATEAKAETKADAEAKAPEGAEPQASAQERLAALDVTVSRGGLRHILAGHAKGACKYKSQFAAEFSTQAGLEALLAQGLEQAAARGRSQAETYDQGGRRVTYCTRAGVGHLNCYGNLVPTSTFAVVTEYYWSADGGVHDVVTAYPVRD